MGRVLRHSPFSFVLLLGVWECFSALNTNFSADKVRSHLVRNSVSSATILVMATNQLTAIAEATQFPKHWDIYWALRTYPNVFSIEEAVSAMAFAQYEGWVGVDASDETVRLVFRKYEMLTNATQCSSPAPCKCPRC